MMSYPDDLTQHQLEIFRVDICQIDQREDIASFTVIRCVLRDFFFAKSHGVHSTPYKLEGKERCEIKTFFFSLVALCAVVIHLQPIT